MIDCEDLFHKIHNSNEEELLNLVHKTSAFGAKEIIQILDFLEYKSPALHTGMTVYDCCGTGGDGANTFNISTTAAIIAASNDVKICKNGGRSTTSKTGSVDVLEALGLSLNIDYKQKLEALRSHNLGFFSSPVSAELLSPIKQICRKQKETCFLSLIGPLASPIILESQVIGVGKKEWLNTMTDLATAYIKDGKRKKILLIQSKVFESDQILDELSTASESLILEITDSGIKEFSFNPKNFDYKLCFLKDLASGKDHNESAQIINSILENKSSQERIETACLNAGLISCLKETNFEIDKLRAETNKCLDLIKTGESQENFNKLKQIYN